MSSAAVRPPGIARPPRIYYGWWIVFTAVVTAACYAFATLSLPVFYPDLVKTFHWSRASVAGGGSLRLFLVGIMAPINGALIDRFGAKVVLSIAAFGAGLSLAMLYSVNSIWQYYLFCFLLGIFVSGIHHMPNHLLVANWFTKNRGLAISLVTTAVGAGGALIPLIATYLITAFGWRNAFLVLGSFLAVPFLLIVGIVREKPGELDVEPDGGPAAKSKGKHSAADPTEAAPTISVGNLLKSPVFWFLSLGMMLMAACQFGVREHLVLYLRDLKFSPATSATALSLILGSSILGRLLSGSMSDKFSARRITVLNFLLGGLSILMLLFVSGFMLIYLFPVLFGLSYGAIINLKPLVIFEYFGTKKVGKVYGLVLGCYLMGSAIGPLVTGYIFDKTRSYQAPFVVNLLMACVAILAILVFANCTPPQRHRNYEGG